MKGGDYSRGSFSRLPFCDFDRLKRERGETENQRQLPKSYKGKRSGKEVQ